MKTRLWLRKARKASRGIRRAVGQLGAGTSPHGVRHLAENATKISMYLVVVMFLSICVHAQQKLPAWHGHSIQPGLTTPQCLIEGDPDHLGFGPCNLLTAKFNPDYISRRDVIIFMPKGYKQRPLSRNFWLLEAATIGMGVLDEERTQHLLHEKLNCNAAGQCFQYREADPILGHTRAQAYSVLGAIDVANVLVGRSMQRYEEMRSQVGLPEWRHGFSAWFYNYRVPLFGQCLVHLVEILRTAHTVL